MIQTLNAPITEQAAQIYILPLQTTEEMSNSLTRYLWANTLIKKIFHLDMLIESQYYFGLVKDDASYLYPHIRPEYTIQDAAPKPEPAKTPQEAEQLIAEFNARYPIPPRIEFGGTIDDPVWFIYTIGNSAKALKNALKLADAMGGQSLAIPNDYQCDVMKVAKSIFGKNTPRNIFVQSKP